MITQVRNSTLFGSQAASKCVPQSSQPIRPLAGPVSFGQHPMQSDQKIDDDIYNLIRAIPKTILHDHFAGSVDLAVPKMELLADGMRMGLDAETLRERLRVIRAMEYQKNFNRTDLHDDGVRDTETLSGLKRHAKKYDENSRLAKIKQIENAYLSSYLYAFRAARENVRYFELRTNPYPSNGTPEEMMEYVMQGIQDAQTELGKSREKVDYGLIMLAYRHGDNTINPETGNKKKVDKAIEIAKLSINLKEKGYPISGVDLAGGEEDNPVSDFGPYFKVIHEYNDRMVKEGTSEKRLGITVHAGETPKKGSGHLTGPESIREAIRLAWSENTPLRIGHATCIEEDPSLVEEVKRKNIGLEMCPKSNIQVEAVDWYPEHPATRLSRQGVPVSISPDNQTVSKTDATNEFVKLHRYCKTGHEDRRRMVLSGLETAFIMDPKKKQALIDEVNAEFDKLEHKPKMAYARYKEQKAFGQNPPLTFEVLDGLLEKARAGNPKKPVNIYMLLSEAAGKPLGLLEFAPFAIRHWLKESSEKISNLLMDFSKQLKSVFSQSG